MYKIFQFIFIVCFTQQAFAQIKPINTQVLVVGGTTGGTAAGIQSARSGATTIIVEQTHMLGGMLTAAAVSCTDGNDGLKSGIWQEFREALYQHYGTRNLASGWVSNTCFEPHIGDSIFKSWAAKEKNLQVLYGWYFNKAIVANNKITGAQFINAKGEKLTVRATIIIDATDLGDVFASAGAVFDLGMEDSAYTGESEARVKNDIIQDLTWAAVLKDYGPGANKTIPVPQVYDPAQYYCSTKDAPCNAKPYPLGTQQVLNYGKLTTTDTTHAKYMLNWPVHGNDYYLNVVAMKPIKREAEYLKARNQTLGFIYFLQTQLGFKNIGLAEDEVNNGIAWMPYHREGRRVKGVVRLTINHIKSPFSYDLYKTGIAVGDYPVDHHHGKYNGIVPDIVFPQVPSFNIPLGALIPQTLDGLIVCDKGISVSNIANGTTRLQPLVLLTGQAAGLMAAQCIQQKIQPRNMEVRKIQQALLNMHCYIMPYCDVDPTDPAWEAIQKTGAMGLLKGVGKSIDWENKTYFYPDSAILGEEFSIGLHSNFDSVVFDKNLFNKQLTIDDAKDILLDNSNLLFNKIEASRPAPTPSLFFDARFWNEKLHLSNFDLNRTITRKEFAVFLNYYQDYFKTYPLSLKGEMMAK
jgi:hypothetical protein